MIFLGEPVKGNVRKKRDKKDMERMKMGAFHARNSYATPAIKKRVLAWKRGGKGKPRGGWAIVGGGGVTSLIFRCGIAGFTEEKKRGYEGVSERWRGIFHQEGGGVVARNSRGGGGRHDFS